MDNQAKKPRNFRLSLVDALSHERLWSVRFSRTTFIAACISAVVAVITAIWCIIAFTPVKTFIPGYPDAHSRRQAVQNALRIDTLETRILQWELYTENLRRVVAGEEPIRMDSLILGSQGSRAIPDSVWLSLRDSVLREEVARKEQFDVNSSARGNLPLEALSFYTPVKGVVSEDFSSVSHPWLDIAAPAGTMVMAVLDGTVVFTGWDQEEAYTLVIQHSGDILSVYKRNGRLLHGQGDKVKAGTPVGMVAASDASDKGDFLHFELWSGGTAVDPREYMNF
jgi:murein DD-endopeptidase MepM/ murein hydrolase activator NlpD